MIAMSKGRTACRRACKWLVPVLATAGVMGPVPGQVGWSNRTRELGPRAGQATAYDIQRGRTVLFGGNAGGVLRGDTWEWDASGWTHRASASAPQPRYDHALAYDLQRGRTVLFGGVGNAAFFGDTWEWDGASWIQRTPAVSPAGRCDHALAFDVARGRAVLFGGRAHSTLFQDTWEWDGANWVDVTPAQSPPARFSHALAHDMSRGRTVLFGGSLLGGLAAADTWEWDGTSWIARQPLSSPPPRTGHALAFDLARARTVTFGGGSAVAAPATDSTVWEWDGTNWSMVPTVSAPPLRIEGAMACDLARGRTVLFGGLHPQGFLGDTWEWDGSSWSQRTPAIAPPARSRSGSAFDTVRARLLLFGGVTGVFGSAQLFADTWEWDGAAWALRSPANAPPARGGHAIAFDSRRGRAVLFGGGDALFARFQDTWEWDGLDWTQRAPAAVPPGREWHALAYDSARGRTVMFGGLVSIAQAAADTWEWDGTDWIQRTPTRSPPARSGHALAYDPVRRRTLLFGGSAESGLLLADTWEWDGSNWTLRMPGFWPSPRSRHGMVHDSARDRTVVYGGFGMSQGMARRLADTWEWDGVIWIPRTPPEGTPAVENHALVFDPVRARAVLLGDEFAPETWDYGPLVPGTWQPFGTGCAGSAGTPALAARGGLRPYPGNDVTVDVAPVPANTAMLALFGLSRTQWGTRALPAPLTGLGMPGCTLLASPDASLLLTAAGSTATFTIRIPDNASLAGLVFFTQALVSDPPANAAGATASNAAEARIGSK
jgi:hypothetical protein